MLCFSCVLYLEYRAVVSRLYMPLYATLALQLWLLLPLTHHAHKWDRVDTLTNIRLILFSDILMQDTI
jgi:hypothetical protein